jgi:hypothetical protein
MKKLLALGAVLMFATTANAAVIWFGDLDNDPMAADPYEHADGMTLYVSDVAHIGMFMYVDTLDYYGPPRTETLTFMNAWFDTTGPDGINGGEENFELTGLDYHLGNLWLDVNRSPMMPNFVPSGGFGDGTFTEPITAEGYSGLMGLNADGEFPISTEGSYLVDEIIIHCTAESVDWLFFENAKTAEPGTTPRNPLLFNEALQSLTIVALASGYDALGEMYVENGWAFGNIIANWRPFVITQIIPEPASLALLAFGGLALIRRRK